jgi:RNA-directed DNA polymerase
MRDDDGRTGACLANNVRELQVKLYLAAKRSPGRRFHALWDRIHRRDVLERAWQQVRANRGSAGVDRVTITEIESSALPAAWHVPTASGP